MQRYKQDALAELYSLEARIKSARKSLRDTANATTAHIAEATLPSLTRKADALRAEAATLPERPPREFAWAASGDDWKRPCPVAADDPIFATLDIPDFLKRAT
jgi:hypothetical protein